MKHKPQVNDHPDADLLRGITLTKMQAKLVRVLSDGRPHESTELLKCIDELADNSHLIKHMFEIRKKLRTIGHELLSTRINRKLHYQHVVNLMTHKEAVES